MSLRPARIAVPGLRNADPTSLLVMIQDLMNRNIAHLEGGTLADLFALAELGDKLPKHLHRELDRVARAKERELRDLPDGALLEDQLDQLIAVPPIHMPERLRQAVIGLRGGRQLEGNSLLMFSALVKSWEGVEPQPPQPGKAAAANVERPAVPKRFQMPDEPSPRQRARAVAPARPTVAATPAAKLDEGRALWIRQHVIERLKARKEQGLKETILVAATCHNSPFSDMQRSEVLAELRELKREGSVKNSAGRWIRVQRLGW